MRFAIVGSRGFPSTYGGYETLVRYLARYLVEQGHETTVYCRSRDESRRSWVTEDVRCIATWGRDTKSLSTLTYGLTSISHAALRRYDAALVLNIANGYWIPALKAARVPFAVNTDGIEWERGKWSSLGKAVFRGGASMTARFADELIADSEAIASRWEELFGRGSTFIPYGAPILERAERDRLHSIQAASKPYVLVVARLAPENNVELTLDALELLGDSAPNAIVVGSANFDSPIEHRLRALEDRGVVSWLGHVDDQKLLTELWANSAVYVHGHSVGGTNPALLQAMGAGAPTLALDTVYSREVVRDERQLFPEDASALAERIEQVVASPERQERMRRNGQEIIRSRYSWPDVCQRYTDVLVQLAGGSPVASIPDAADIDESEVA
jgi:glycosyltransferase involved in cell wall biosynthesis